MFVRWLLLIVLMCFGVCYCCWLVVVGSWFCFVFIVCCVVGIMFVICCFCLLVVVLVILVMARCLLGCAVGFL